MGPLIILFWTSSDVSSGFKAREGSLINTWWRHTYYTFPEIHLWCDTYWPLGSQHGSWTNLFHVPASSHQWDLKLGANMPQMTNSTFWLCGGSSGIALPKFSHTVRICRWLIVTVWGLDQSHPLTEVLSLHYPHPSSLVTSLLTIHSIQKWYLPRLTRMPSPETLAFFAVNIVLFLNPVFGSGIVVRWCRSLTGISVCLLGYILSYCSLGPRCKITLICLIVILSHMSISSGSV